ncbi:MAG: Na+/H+ antiporter NhaC family protein [Alphaproteobacteria bacterium]|nr:Na+/H+ antiporter NhaC family protein [Alphaproteobacteria bacterium]
MDASWWGWDGGLTLLAPTVAIVVALLSRRVVASLAAGVAVGAVVAAQGRLLPPGADCFAAAAAGEAPPDAGALCGAFGYAGQAVLSTDNLTISVFTLLVAAMVGVMVDGGAMRTLVAAMEARARGPRATMLASWLSGLVVFFDDYANCVVVGHAMAPVCDRQGVSRAKLAYIVDSTAAPVASLALVGTWVGFEVGLLEDALVQAGQPAGGGFGLFLSGLANRYYSLYALALVGLVAWTGRDLGPMLTAERRARAAAVATEPDPAPPRGAVVAAAVPVLLLVGVTLGAMVRSGIAALEVPVAEAPLYAVLADADAYGSMLWGGVAGLAAAVLLALRAPGLGPQRVVGASLRGMRTVAAALVVLYTAWTLGNAIGDTGARDFLLGQLGPTLPSWVLPSAVFVLSSLVAFATGTSFGTMSILVPLAVPLAVGMEGGSALLTAATASAVLSGSCLGDHASPISDTTVLSAVGSGCDLVEHVQTQVPYALLAGAVALLLGYLPAGLGVPPWLLLPPGLVALYATLRWVGEEA